MYMNVLQQKYKFCGDYGMFSGCYIFMFLFFVITVNIGKLRICKFKSTDKLHQTNYNYLHIKYYKTFRMLVTFVQLLILYIST